ncbi:pectinesterase [Agrobacterium vitis]|nr:pectinesterase [Agrobacterium vitis]MBE1438338.1 pectinesterase [Agrobacterium vitis]
MAALVYGASPAISVAEATRQPDAVVDQSHKGDDAELAGGIPIFSTIAAALSAAPDRSDRAWTISVNPGQYREKLTITKPRIRLLGSGKDKTRIVFDAYAGAQKPDGTGHWGTPGSATVTVNAADFTARHLTIANDFDFLDNDRRDPDGANRIGASQAVAVFLGNGADRSLFYDVSLSGYQDTLFADCGRSLFSHCIISGNVDFIFGGGIALFDHCDIISRPRATPHILPAGFVAAPSTSKHNAFGLIFRHCYLAKENADQPAGSHYLGRPWHPTRDFADGRYADPDAIGQAVFLQCSMEDHIAADGWTAMSGLAKEGHRTWFQPLQDARFFEYQSNGPGAHVNQHRPQLSDAVAATYTNARIFGDWQPDEKQDM